MPIKEIELSSSKIVLNGNTLFKPPNLYIYCSSITECITVAAVKNNNALKKAWVNRW